MFEFAWPWMSLLLLLPLAMRWIAPAIKGGGRLGSLRFPHMETLQLAFGAPVSSDRRTDALFLTLLWLGWAGLTGALMQPQNVDQLAQVTNEGYDIMLCVDLSGSMAALDFSRGGDRVNRLAVAKEAVDKFVKDRASDRIGLVLFGSSAYQYAPLTQDTQSVAKMLDTAAINMAGDGTAIGDALGIAVKGLRDRPEKSRIIVLMTDGGDNASTLPPLQAAQLARNYGIRIYTVGIGSSGMVPIPDQYGHIEYDEFPVDEKLLKDVADKTGGGYFRATDADALQQVYHDIDKMEKSTVDKRQYMVRTPLYRYPLGVALACLALASLLPLWRARGAHAS